MNRMLCHSVAFTLGSSGKFGNKFELIIDASEYSVLHGQTNLSVGFDSPPQF